MPTPFDDAYDDALRGCFDVLVDSLALAANARDSDAIAKAELAAVAKFYKGCDLCKKALKIAELMPTKRSGVPCVE